MGLQKMEDVPDNGWCDYLLYVHQVYRVWTHFDTFGLYEPGYKDLFYMYLVFMS